MSVVRRAISAHLSLSATATDHAGSGRVDLPRLPVVDLHAYRRALRTCAMDAEAVVFVL